MKIVDFGNATFFSSVILIATDFTLLIVGRIMKELNGGDSSIGVQLDKAGLQLMIFGGIGLLLSSVLCSMS